MDNFNDDFDEIEEVDEEKEVESEEAEEPTEELEKEEVVETETEVEESDEDDEGGNGKEKGFIIAISVLSVLIIAILLLFFLKSCKKEDNKTSNSNTETNTNSTATSNSSSTDYVTILFDSTGGSDVESVKIKKGESVELPIPKRDGYKFEGWYSGSNIVDDYYRYDKDTTLVAKWSKTSNSNSNSASNSNSNKSVTYTCPDGYKLDGKKCTITKDATLTCPSGTREDGDKCVNLNDSNAGTRTCNNMYIEGHDYVGEYYQPQGGPATCAYAPINQYTTKETCEAAAPSNPYGWYNNKCYKKVITGNPSYTVKCSSGYTYYSSADLQSKFKANANGMCFKTQSKTASCDDGYTVSGTKCTKTVDATEKK